MKIHLLIDDEQYESTILIAAYADKDMAVRRGARMTKSLAAWQKKQQALEDKGSDEAYSSNAPHYYHHLAVVSMNVIPANRQRSGAPAQEAESRS
jgi:hypothetical protein